MGRVERESRRVIVTLYGGMGMRMKDIRST